MSQIKVFATGGDGAHAAFVHRGRQNQHTFMFLVAPLRFG